MHVYAARLKAESSLGDMYLFIVCSLTNLALKRFQFELSHNSSGKFDEISIYTFLFSDLCSAIIPPPFPWKVSSSHFVPQIPPFETFHPFASLIVIVLRAAPCAVYAF